MSIATQIDVFKKLNIAPSAHSDAEFDQMANAFGYLPRLQQYTDASAQVKKKELQAGFYVVTGKDDKVFLGEDVDVIPLAWRFKALETLPGVKPRSSTNPKSELFREIQAQSGKQNSHCQAGIEYLLWVPAAGKYATYLMGSKTAVKEASKLKPLIGCVATIKTFTYENDQFVWQGPKVLEASVPPASLPPEEGLQDEIDRFKAAQEEAGDGPQEKIEEAPTKRKR